MKVTSPSVEDVKNWAYAPDPWPHDEWDLFLSWTEEVSLFVELAIDPRCAKQSFFLHMLYYLVGVTFSRPHKSDGVEKIKAWAASIGPIQNESIQLWRHRSEQLVRGKLGYEYKDWRGGQFANYTFS